MSSERWYKEVQERNYPELITYSKGAGTILPAPLDFLPFSLPKDFFFFPDISWHKGTLDMQVFVDAGCPLVISKASDNYYLKDDDGNYYYDEEHHVDREFVRNYTKTRAKNLVAAGYHFGRWDRPKASEEEIFAANLRYYLDAISRLPQELQNVKVGILDLEQHSEQMEAIGITGASEKMQRMTKGIVQAYLDRFDVVIVYTAVWWWYWYLTKETQEWLAERVSLWSTRDYYVNPDTLVDNKPEIVPEFPTLPAGFKPIYATSANDVVGKLFALQYTSAGQYPGISSGIDMNYTALNSNELYTLFHAGPGCKSFIQSLRG